MPVFSVTILSVLFLLFTLIYLVALAYVVLLERRRATGEGVAADHVFSLLVPARNEATVLENCLRSLLALDYPADRFEILVVDDDSEDETGAIAARYAAELPSRVRTIRIPARKGSQGKAAVLNAGYAHLRRNSRFRDDPAWIIGVFDADATPDRDMLGKASFQFRNPRIGGVQATVRIRNRDTSWLTRMQDIEFAGFARMTQLIRSRITDSASLGGNGQFVRSVALDRAAVDPEHDRYWNPSALTEDLELATRMALSNWDVYQLDTSRVWQQGVESAGALLRQRTRWAWGSLQVFIDYVVRLRVFRAKDVRLRKRLDLVFSLSVFLVSPLVMVTWAVSAFSFFNLVSVASAFPSPVMVLLSFGYFPLVGYGLLTTDGFPGRTLPADLIGFAIYTYHWVPCLYIGLWHVAARHVPVWSKTKRVTERSAG